jgi:hypothetical protein
MGKRHVNYRDILNAETAVTEIASTKMEKWFLKFEELINLLLELNHYFDSDLTAQEETQENRLFVFIQDKYFEAPYSFRACHSLMERGYYLQAMTDLRSLLDYFVSCRFFDSHPQYITPYLSGEKCQINGKKDWIKTSDIYNFFSKKFYDRYWGKMLSVLSHRKLGTSPFRINRENPEKPYVILVPEFNLKYSLAVVNHLIPLFLGHFMHWELFFHGWIKELPGDLAQKRTDAIVWLKEQHLKSKGVNEEWLEGMNQILGIC